jgi:small subunit ribosomal protein S5
LIKEEEEAQLTEKVVYINRVAKVVKGGRRFSFSAIVVVGDGKGMVGVGLGKANEVPEAIRKGGEKAKRDMRQVSILKNSISYRVIGICGSSSVLLKPARPGTGIIAGGPVRAVLEVAGIRNIVSKCLRSHNPHNLVKATLNGLMSLRTPEEIARSRGKAVEEIVT